jgi:signal transduction histidine kinase/CHASE3 domain sensor protein
MIKFGRWWDQLRVRQKVTAVVLVLCVPLIASLVVHVTLIQQLLAVQQQHEQAVQSRGQVRLLLSLVVDIENAFRGYLLTRQDEFLRPMREAESNLKPTVAAAGVLAGDEPGLVNDIRGLGERTTALLESKRGLIRRVQAGHLDEVLEYVRSGKGLALSDALRRDIRNVEDKLDRRLKSLDAAESMLARRAFWGLLLAVVGGLALGVLCARLLTRSITGPLTVLQASVSQLGGDSGSSHDVSTIPVHSSDEIGQLARSYEEMARRIQRHIRELEAINAIGNEINTIGPDGLYGVLKRIINRASEMLQVDVCMVMLRDDRMGCWVVEAASGEWDEKLRKSVMLWEEFPVAVRSFETGQLAIVEDLRSDWRPEVVRRNLMGESMLSIPLLAHGAPFGVLVFVQAREVRQEDWNLRLAKGFTDEAAIAISNARLYEAAMQKGEGLESRLKQLEHLAETLAHDLKSPGERMEGLSSLLLQKHGGTLDQETTRLLALIRENGKMLSERIETILEVARVGARHQAVEAVDPGLVISDVLKSRSGELEARKVRVHVAREFPLVPCHRAYLRQVFDNLISNAVKFSQDSPSPEIRIEARVKEERVHFSVSDNGCGILPQHRERAFEPFVRVGSSSTKGMGIGLTIVKRIVELYGEQVWIEPQDPPGCTVTFTLPPLGDFSPLWSRSTPTASPVPPNSEE